jgi:AcrR family transcriptional regulator
VTLLAERGLAAMSIEEVAARAGVGKATIYRRWPSKGLLALDAFVASFREQQPLPDTGTLRGDLLAALRAWVRAVTRTPMGPMLADLIAEAQHDPELRGAWRDRVLEPMRTQHRIMLDRAMARGEIPATVNREVVLDLFFGAAEHRLLLGHLPMTEAFIAEVVEVILRGVELLTGVLVVVVLVLDVVLVVVLGQGCFGFDLHQPRWVEQAGHDHGGRGWADLGEDVAVRAGHLAPVTGVGEVDAGADDVLQAGARLAEGLADQVQAEPGLRVRPAGRRPSAGWDGRGPGDQDPVADHDRAGEAEDRLVGRVPADASMLHARHCRIRCPWCAAPPPQPLLHARWGFRRLHGVPRTP